MSITFSPSIQPLLTLIRIIEISFVQTILNNTFWKKLFVVKPPGGCGGSYAPLWQFLTKHPQAVIVPESSDYTISSFDHFLLLLSAKKIIEDRYSTFSFWAGFFSNATEIHVDARYHGVLNDPKYVYHDQTTHSFFGIYNASNSIKQGAVFDRVSFPYRNNYSEWSIEHDKMMADVHLKPSKLHRPLGRENSLHAASSSALIEELHRRGYLVQLLQVPNNSASTMVHTS